MSRNKIFVCTLVILPALFFAIGAFCQNQTTTKGIKQLIDAEIPIGSSKSQVESFLDLHKIEHSEYISFAEESSYKEEYLAQRRGLESKLEVIDGFISAKVSKAKKDFFNEWDIHLKLYFDNEGKLIEYQIYTIGTGV